MVETNIAQLWGGWVTALNADMSSDTYKVLVVDDEREVAKVTAQVLAADLNCEILVASSGKHAIELMKREDIAVVLCDLYMPEMDGAAVAEATYRVDDRIVIIMVTGSISASSCRSGLPTHVLWKCIEKPWNPDILVRNVKDALLVHHGRRLARRQAATPAPSEPDTSAPNALPTPAALDQPSAPSSTTTPHPPETSIPTPNGSSALVSSVATELAVSSTPALPDPSAPAALNKGLAPTDKLAPVKAMEDMLAEASIGAPAQPNADSEFREIPLRHYKSDNRTTRKESKHPLRIHLPPKAPPPAALPQRKFPGKGLFIRKPSRGQTSELPPSPPITPRPPARASIDLVSSRFRIVELIKEGGSGAIYKADDTLLRMPVAIKILSESITNNRETMAELFSEARIAMQLSHKHIVRLHNLEESNGLFYLVMEYIDGSTLREILASQGSFDIETMKQIVEVLCDALSHAHRRMVYHRDLKPDNVMVSRDGVVKIIDFGLACFAVPGRATDEIEGTPYYVSPEEIKGETVDHRSDIFAMGVMIAELMTGALPPSATPLDNGSGFLSYTPIIPDSIAEPLRSTLQQAVAIDPNERWPDIFSFANAFRVASDAVLRQNQSHS